MKPLELQTLLRPPNKDDIGFVCRSWMRFMESSPHRHRVDHEVYDYFEHRFIERVWKDGVIIISCFPEPEQGTYLNYGFIAFEHSDVGPILHALYVKRNLRSQGVGTEMVRYMVDTCPTYSGRVYHTRSTGSLRSYLEAHEAPFGVPSWVYIAGYDAFGGK